MTILACLAYLIQSCLNGGKLLLDLCKLVLKATCSRRFVARDWRRKINVFSVVSAKCAWAVHRDEEPLCILYCANMIPDCSPCICDRSSNDSKKLRPVLRAGTQQPPC